MIPKVFQLVRNCNKISSNFRQFSMSAARQQLVLTERLGKVFIITINRPEKRNCVNPATANALTKAVEELENDKDVLVGILQGQGGNFCAGYDLKELSEMPKDSNLDQAKTEHSIMSSEALAEGHGPMGPSRRFIKKPLLAAVEGYAVAGGLELALMCDMRIVSESAVLGVYCRRFGVPLLDGGTVRLPQLIGLSRALDLILTGRGVKGPEALKLGLANRVVSTGTSLGEAIKIAQALCTFPQECLLRDRMSAYNSCFDAATLKDAFQLEFENAIHVIAQESVHGAGKFVKGIGRKGSFNLNKSNL